MHNGETGAGVNDGEIYFSSNYRDQCEQHGSGAGFQFDFYCSRCHDTWRSPFTPYNRGRMAGWAEKASGLASGFLGSGGYGASRAVDGLAEAGWGPARDEAFRHAITGAQSHFNRCPRCTDYVCDRCWNAGQGMCLQCLPDTAAEALAARQQGLNDAVSDRSYAVGQQSGQRFDVNTDRQLVCPQCSTESRGAAYCSGCGHHLAQPDPCGSCRNPVPQGAAFCPSCGTRR
ncbi:double zinc ribbon domain-containing protein [Streptomyces sp. NBC_00996]|uniref:double zinc ribbon domain-containing protein n=1 Tax=Streptomyces sp. NBC_00996 TaxID=2903710 RepID=UPI00386AA251|nr:zinc ribbon domain-containing protein [Streptomyces sp. NBC_00996]